MMLTVHSKSNYHVWNCVSKMFKPTALALPLHISTAVVVSMSHLKVTLKGIVII